jgi:arabinoxylan arabinofuranohydrolase
VYIYLTGDVYDYDDHGKLKENNYSKINKIVVISSEDLINWTDHGEINVAGSDGIAAWAAHSWAPAVACKNIGGEDRFFLYFANDASNIGVLTAGSPTGPWTDPLGKPLIHRGIPGVKDVTWCFDPAVLVDDDGSGYLYFGGGLPSRTQQDALHPKTARVIKLGGDMISTDGEAVVIDAPALFEDSGINKINGWYYYSYCSNFSGEHPKGYPPYGEIAYMLSKSPMGPFVYAGTVLKNPQHFFGAGGNNHHCIFNFKGEWYIAYHAQTLGLALGRQKGYRSPHIDKLSFYQNGAIRPVEAGYISEPPVVRVNPYTRNEAEAFAWGSGVTVAGTGSRYVTDIHNGDWLAVANVDFPYWEELLFTVRVASDVGGEIEVRVDNPQGMLVGVLGIGSTGGSGRWEEMSCRMAAPFGLHHLFFVFKGDSERNLFDFDYWTFTE